MDSKKEGDILNLIATHRHNILISALSGRLKRRERNLVSSIGLKEGERFSGERAYAYVERSEKLKARGMREGIEEFKKKYPKYGEILEKMIKERRLKRELHMHYGLNGGRRISKKMYVSVLEDMGFSSKTAEKLYSEIIKISRGIAKKRGELENRILIG